MNSGTRYRCECSFALCFAEEEEEEEEAEEEEEEEVGVKRGKRVCSTDFGRRCAQARRTKCLLTGTKVQAYWYKSTNTDTDFVHRLRVACRNVSWILSRPPPAPAKLQLQLLLRRAAEHR